MKTTARLILFLDCPRKCRGCCNEYPQHKAAMRPISSLDDLEPYAEIILTGGEPMLKPEMTLGFLAKLRKRFPNKTVYLYTAMYNHRALVAALPHLDGLHYTLHADASAAEVMDLQLLQLVLTMQDYKGSVRLYVDNAMPLAVEVVPNLWSRVEMKPWLGEGFCPLPDHEDLLIWDAQ